MIRSFLQPILWLETLLASNLKLNVFSLFSYLLLAIARSILFLLPLIIPKSLYMWNDFHNNWSVLVKLHSSAIVYNRKSQL